MCRNYLVKWQAHYKHPLYIDIVINCYWKRSLHAPGLLIIYVQEIPSSKIYHKNLVKHLQRKANYLFAVNVSDSRRFLIITHEYSQSFIWSRSGTKFLKWKSLNHVQKVTFRKNLKFVPKCHFLKNMTLIIMTYCKWGVIGNTVTVLLQRSYCGDNGLKTRFLKMGLKSYNLQWMIHKLVSRCYPSMDFIITGTFTHIKNRLGDDQHWCKCVRVPTILYWNVLVKISEKDSK